jgi:hypothetical protein
MHFPRPIDSVFPSVFDLAIAFIDVQVDDVINKSKYLG